MIRAVVLVVVAVAVPRIAVADGPCDAEAASVRGKRDPSLAPPTDATAVARMKSGNDHHREALKRAAVVATRDLRLGDANIEIGVYYLDAMRAAHPEEGYMALVEDVTGFNRQLCVDQWSLLDGGRRTAAPRLIFPKGQGGDVRISEQEARVLYCAIIDQQDKYCYSIETPTSGKYRFVDADPNGAMQSALSDMSLYENGERVVNIELKAHNCAPKQIDKDISKLVREDCVGNWFHTLKNIDGGTLPSLFAKFRSGSSTVADWPRRPVIFTFCVLEKKWAISKTLAAQPDRESFAKVTAEFFDIGYSAAGGTVTVSDANGWEVITSGI